VKLANLAATALKGAPAKAVTGIDGIALIAMTGLSAANAVLRSVSSHRTTPIKSRPRVQLGNETLTGRLAKAVITRNPAKPVREGKAANSANLGSATIVSFGKVERFGNQEITGILANLGKSAAIVPKELTALTGKTIVVGAATAITGIAISAVGKLMSRRFLKTMS
jgi:hypothetical protein